MPGIGPRLPFVRSVNSSIGARHAYEDKIFPLSNSEKEAAISSIQNIFGTRRGERVMRPRFGGSLAVLAFEQADEGTALLGSDLIRENINRFEPRVRIVGIQSSIDAVNGSVIWNVRLQLKENPDEEFNLQFRP